MHADAPLVGWRHGSVLRPPQPLVRGRDDRVAGSGGGRSVDGHLVGPDGAVAGDRRRTTVTSTTQTSWEACPTSSPAFPRERASVMWIPRRHIAGALLIAGTAECFNPVIEGTSAAPSEDSGSSQSTTSTSADLMPTTSEPGSASSTSMQPVTTSASSTDDSSGALGETTSMSSDLPSQCPDPDCDPLDLDSCPAGTVCQATLRICMSLCSVGGCPFACIDQDDGHYDPRGVCPPCDTGAQPGECIVEHMCTATGGECERFGLTCQTYFGWCMETCTPECEWQCVEADDNRLGRDLCSFCDLSKALEP